MLPHSMLNLRSNSKRVI